MTVKEKDLKLLLLLDYQFHLNLLFQLECLNLNYHPLHHQKFLN